MNLAALEMKKEMWGEDKGLFVGTATFTGEMGRVQVKLEPNHCQAILELCADAIVSNAREVANAMVLPLIEATAIPEQTNDQI